MKLRAFAAGLAIAAIPVMSGGSAVHALSTNNENKKPIAQPASFVQKATTVTINSGDTLTSIANAHNTTYVRLYDANEKITNPDLIYAGDSLQIPDPSETLPSRELPSNAPAEASKVSA